MVSALIALCHSRPSTEVRWRRQDGFTLGTGRKDAKAAGWDSGRNVAAHGLGFSADKLTWSCPEDVGLGGSSAVQGKGRGGQMINSLLFMDQFEYLLY